MSNWIHPDIGAALTSDWRKALTRSERCDADEAWVLVRLRVDFMKDDDQTLRVSTPEQTTGNQVQEITASGFHVEPHRIVTETISGGVAISQRPEFARLADRLEAGDVLVVTKLDRLGRNAMDVAATAAGLDTAGIKAHRPAHDGIIRASARQRTPLSASSSPEFTRPDRR